MSVQVEPRTCVIGGQTRPRRMFGKLSTGAVVVLGLLGLGWVVLIIISKSLLVIGLGLALGFVLLYLATRVTDEGDGWTRTVLDRARFRVERGIGLFGWTLVQPRPLWEPAVGRVPRPVGQLREIDAPVGGGGLVSILHHADPRKGFHEGHFTAVLEVIGGGDGLVETTTTNARGERFGRLLGSLASTQMPVSQLDSETRVVPTDPADYRDHVESLLDPAAPHRILESMRELTEVGAGSSETYRSFVTVKMPMDQVLSKTFGSDALPDVVETVTETLRVTVERFTRAGYDVRSVLGPRRVAAHIRHTYVPSWGVDELDGLETVADAFAFFGYEHGPAGRSLRVEGGDRGAWWHAAASIPMDGWPTGPVGVRWLEGIVTDTSAVVIRTVKAQHHLVPKREARTQGALGRTYDEADLVSEAKKGSVSTGETEAQANASSRLLQDLLDGAAGDRPALRLLVSAQDPRDLEEARSVLETATEEMGIQRVLWYDRRHDLAMALHCPFGKGIKP